MDNFIKIRGARQHNLQNISLDIPKNKFVVFTGVSGSGKSSLAFDTIYAEGQRRYVESLSAYARQFLGVMDKPDVDSIEGLSPSISIDQKSTSHNPRSTVGTITEIYDYLRLLFARIGHPHCPNCGREISRMSVDEIAEKIIDTMIMGQTQGFVPTEKHVGDNPRVVPIISSIIGNAPILYRILSPVVRGRKGEFKDLFLNIRSKGFAKIRIDKKEYDLANAEKLALIKTNKHDVDVFVDTISVRKSDLRDEVFSSNLKSRLRQAVEQSVSLSDGLVVLSTDRHGGLSLQKKENSGEHLFSEKFSCPVCNISLPELEPRMFSFNSPIGACEECKGLGTIYCIDPDRILKKNLSVNEGAILPFNKFFFTDTWYTKLIKQMAEIEKIDLNIAIENMPKDKLQILLYGVKDREYEVFGKNRFGKNTSIIEKFDGVIAELNRRFFGEHAAGFEDMNVQRYLKEEVCEKCNGDKLKPEILGVTINGKNIMEICGLSVRTLLDFVETHHDASLLENANAYELQVATPIIKEIKSRLLFLVNVGLGYLTVGRLAKTLSGGELQRIRLASQIGTGLTGVLYVLDEPSIGLHPKDVAALISSLKNLQNLGNTLIVVEHDAETMEAADWLVEFGPHAGKNGGKLVFEGSLAQMKKNKKSLTGQYLAGKKQISISVGAHNYVPHGVHSCEPLQENIKVEYLELKCCTQFNLKNIDAKFPLGKLIAVTGVSGSGKSTLIVETLYPALKYYIDGYFLEKMGEFKDIKGTADLKHVYLVDQSPIGRTPRSNPATYVGFFDVIRDIYASTVEARARGFGKSRFSFNLKGGRCEKCQGAGVIKIEMQFLADVYVTCDVCLGRRYNHETLEVLWRGKNISEVLQMTVDEAIDFFVNHPKIHEKLTFLESVGLGYIQLGQPAPTFSGGEAQRMKLANELSRRDSGQNVYILDEPTTGLHFYDVQKLLDTLHALRERGNTVIVIEHNLDVIKNCDWILDLGPDGGDAGGNVVYQGETLGILKCKESYTGEYLKKILN